MCHPLSLCLIFSFQSLTNITQGFMNFSDIPELVGASGVYPQPPWNEGPTQMPQLKLSWVGLECGVPEAQSSKENGKRACVSEKLLQH